MTLKKGNLEDIFIELSETAGTAPQTMEAEREKTALSEKSADETFIPSMEGTPAKSEDTGV